MAFMDEAINAFVAAWLRDNAAVLSEMVALQGDDPTTAYGAALAAAMAAVPPWSPTQVDAELDARARD
jgi:hypothetical protein